MKNSTKIVLGIIILIFIGIICFGGYKIVKMDTKINEQKQEINDLKNADKQTPVESEKKRIAGSVEKGIAEMTSILPESIDYLITKADVYYSPLGYNIIFDSSVFTPTHNNGKDVFSYKGDNSEAKIKFTIEKGTEGDWNANYDRSLLFQMIRDYTDETNPKYLKITVESNISQIGHDELLETIGCYLRDIGHYIIFE